MLCISWKRRRRYFHSTFRLRSLRLAEPENRGKTRRRDIFIDKIGERLYGVSRMAEKWPKVKPYPEEREKNMPKIKSTASKKVQTEKVEFVRLPIEEIQFHNNLPNREVETGTQENELVDSIKEVGLLNPVSVAKVGSKHYVVAGRRRLKAIGVLKETDPAVFDRLFSEGVPCCIVSSEVRSARRSQLAENITRADLNPYDVAFEIFKMRKAGESAAKIADALGRSAVYVNNYFNFWSKASLRMKEAVKEGKVTFSDACEHIRLTPKQQNALLDKVEAGETVERVSKKSNKPSAKAIRAYIESFAAAAQEDKRRLKYSEPDLYYAMYELLRYVVGDITEEQFTTAVMSSTLSVNRVNAFAEESLNEDAEEAAEKEE